MTYPRSNAADGVNLIAESSIDLVSWQPVPEPVAYGASAQPGTDLITVRAPLPVTAGVRQFLRLRVEQK